MIRILLPLLLFIISTKISFSQTDKISDYISVADTITKTALRDRKGYDWLKELCEIGPRLSGSENSMKAILWAKNKMTELGFDSVWLQPVMVPHWERGNKEFCAIYNDKIMIKKLEVLALGGSVSTPENGIEANVIEIKSFDELKQKASEVKGKIVFFNRPIDQGMTNTFAGYGSAVDQRVYGAIEAAKYGAIGVVIRSVTTKFDNVPHAGVMLYVDSLPRIPAAAIGYLDSDFLSEQLKLNPGLVLKLRMNCRTLEDTQSFNVIGEIRGKEFSEEIVVVGGHFDSWDVGCGAHDDGAGCIQSIEVLDLFKRLNIKPKRTIRCVLFINEENGSRGGIEYGKLAASSSEKHIAAIEADRGAFTPVGFNVDSDSITINKISTWLPILEKASIEWVKKGGSGVDVSKIKNAKALLGFVPDDQRYMDVHHSANDVFEEVHPREFELGAAAITVMVYLLSEEGL
ncbi:M20/M25/M40 family metallo-hydrolase [Ignavibacterium album]|nr:M20/M25/M40 family metallo-hydrolase [Ignavibacterium album]